MKIDLTREHKDLYRASAGKPVVVEVPTQLVISVTGRGDPNTSAAYAEALQALYTVAYRLKFASKKDGFDFKVMPLEGQWWADDPAAFAAGNRDDWQWRMFIVVPDFITETAFAAAIEAAGSKGPAALDRVVFETIHEGPAAQILHVGPFAAEAPTIETLHYFIRETGHTFDGQAEKHHEIYLSDPRRTAPEKLKTIIRQPFH